MVKKYGIICLLCALSILCFSFTSLQGTQIAASDPPTGQAVAAPQTQSPPQVQPPSESDAPTPPVAPGEQGQAVPQPPRRPSSDGSEVKTTQYQVDVSVSEQKVRVWEGENLVKELVASTGINDSTPLGEFTIHHRGEWFFSEKYQQGAIWWVAFTKNGKYLFHSLPMDKNKQIIPEEAAKLGAPASHGCIRLSIEDAQWFYDTVPHGTMVYIHD